MFGGLTHEPAVRLCERLCELAPAGLERVFLADSGSVSVEVAIKMCAAVPARARRARAHAPVDGARRLPRRHRRGDGRVRSGRRACTACSPACCREHVFARAPARRLRRAARRALGGRTCAGSLAQHCARARGGDRRAGRAGRGRHALSFACVRRADAQRAATSTACCSCSTRSPPASGARARCSRASTRGVTPDVMCVGKALTGGYMTLAATLCTPAVAEAVSTGEGGGLMHGPTFMANPLACAVALASLELLAERRLARAGRGDRGAACERGSGRARRLSGVADVRVLGAIGVIELERDVDLAAATARGARRRGLAAAVSRPDLRDAPVRDRARRRRPGRSRHRQRGARLARRVTAASASA